MTAYGKEKEMKSKKKKELKPGMNYVDGYFVHVSVAGEREQVMKALADKKEKDDGHRK